MKKLVIICCLVLPVIGFSQDCEDFKTGTFKLKMANGEFIPGYEIIRKKKTQIEKLPEGYLKSKVVWLDDCTYQLIHIKSDFMEIPEGTVSTIKIISTDEDSYDGVGSSELSPETKRFTMYKI